MLYVCPARRANMLGAPADNPQTKPYLRRHWRMLNRNLVLVGIVVGIGFRETRADSRRHPFWGDARLKSQRPKDL